MAPGSPAFLKQPGPLASSNATAIGGRATNTAAATSAPTATPAAPLVSCRSLELELSSDATAWFVDRPGSISDAGRDAAVHHPCHGMRRSSPPERLRSDP